MVRAGQALTPHPILKVLLSYIYEVSAYPLSVFNMEIQLVAAHVGVGFYGTIMYVKLYCSVVEK